MIVVPSSRFARSYKKLVGNNKELKEKFKKTIKLLEIDSDHPSLRNHKLAGTHNWSISVDMAIRVIYHQDGDFLYLTNIGSHDDVY